MVWLLAVVAVGGIVTAALVLNAREFGGPCPSGPMVGVPIAVQFTPGMVEHQSMVFFPIDALPAGTELDACLNGRFISKDILSEGDVRRAGVGMPDGIPIPTRWVDIEWLTGRLAGDSDLNNWTIVVIDANTTAH